MKARSFPQLGNGLILLCLRVWSESLLILIELTVQWRLSENETRICLPPFEDALESILVIQMKMNSLVHGSY